MQDSLWSLFEISDSRLEVDCSVRNVHLILCLIYALFYDLRLVSFE